MKKYFALVIIFLYLTAGAVAQSIKRNTLSVPKFPGYSTRAMIDSLQIYKSDTNKVWLLNKIAAVFWWRRTSGSSDLDSCLLFAQQAGRLSRELNYQPGIYESNFLVVKALPYKNGISQAEQIINSSPGDQRARLNLVLGEHFIYLPGKFKANFDKSLMYMQRALAISKTGGLLHWRQESQIAIAKYYFALGETEKGTYYFKQVIYYWQKAGNIAQEAHWWSDLGKYMPGGNDRLYNLQLSYFKKAFNLYRQIGDKPEMAYAADDIGFAFRELLNNLDSAEYYTSYSIRLLREAKINKLYRYYAHLSEIYYRKGNFHQALSYSLSSLKNMETLNDYQLKGIVTSGLGKIYYSLGEYENSIKYFKLALSELPVTDLYIAHYLAKNISDNLLALKRPKEAISFLLDFEKKHPGDNPVNKEVLLAAKANYFSYLKKYKLAEQYYLEMISLDKLSAEYSGTSWIQSIAGSEANYMVAKFYVDNKRFNLAQGYLQKIDTLHSLTPLLSKDVALLKFKVDSAAGRLLPAIQHFQQYTAFKDSMFNVGNAGRIADLQIQYQTEQKTKDILLLKQEAQLQERRISQSIQGKRFAIAGLAMLALVIGIGFNRYRLKQNSYRLLMSQQQKINEQNDSLQMLNQKQTKLLSEKEWLIKEIHHRVKNNLQMMQSLLKVQERYLQNQDASDAINTSRQRMYAMSLVHQKLYLDNENDKINMSDFIRELISYLRESFDNATNITYNLQLEEIQLDSARAIPVGLIINELVTNAIKYAFLDVRHPEINIVFQANGDLIDLKISDNGAGLGENLDIEGNRSFGITLINGLVNQLDGKIEYKSNPGLNVSIIFGSAYQVEVIEFGQS